MAVGRTTVQDRRWARRWWLAKAVTLVVFSAVLAAHWTHTLKSTAIATLAIVLAVPLTGRLVRYHREWREEHPWQPRVTVPPLPKLPHWRRPRGWPLVREMTHEPARWRLLCHWAWRCQSSPSDHAERGGTLLEALFGPRDSESTATFENGTSLRVVSKIGGDVHPDETADQSAGDASPPSPAMGTVVGTVVDTVPICPVHRTTAGYAYRWKHCRCSVCRQWKRESRRQLNRKEHQ